MSALALEQVQLIPTANPWQREALQRPQRLDMLALAIADQPGLAVNPIEIERGGHHHRHPARPARRCPLRLAAGRDQLANFCTWRAWDEIAERVDMAVAVRPGTPLAPPAELAARLRSWVAGCIPALRAHGRVRLEIRRRLARANPRRACWPSPWPRIAAHNLYR